MAAAGPGFLEIFSGAATLTKAAREAGLPCLPPIDITPCELVPQPFDVVDADNWDFIMALAHAGTIRFLHCGTPCNTFSAARKLDGGPPPLRSHEQPLGLPHLDPENEAMVFLGNLFLQRSCMACLAVYLHGGDFSIENPEFSLMWSTPDIIELKRLTKAWLVDFDQCFFGAPSVKPTRLLVSHQGFDALHHRCPGGHRHEQLKGKVWSDFFGRWVYRTKLAQVYPVALCTQLVRIISSFWADQVPQFELSFRLLSDERKRPVGQALRWHDHRQALSALKAEAAGYQLKCGARKPLLHLETEPGVAIEWALSIPHPLCIEVELDQDLRRCVCNLAADLPAVVQQRLDALHFWETRAIALLPSTSALLASVPDQPLRRLLRGVADDQPCQLGSCCHIALYYEMLEACNSVDAFMPDLLLQGFPIVGPIARSRRWPHYDKAVPVVPVQEALDRAWAMRSKIVNRVRSAPASENLTKIWEATLEDVSEGSTLGPFSCPDQVSELLQCEDWIPTQRFEVVQKNKVRGCDSATTNMINQVTVITEKLQLPSTDTNVAALRMMRSAMPGAKFAGWVLDERKAYRQVAIRPDHRKFSVICIKSPVSLEPAFFVMVGHSFGLVSAVYNYNRRSAAINEILQRLFNLVAFNFYDDKYGFEPLGSVESAFHVAQRIHWLLGAAFDPKKLQLTDKPVILGVTYNLSDWVLEIKANRREELIDEIQSVLRSGVLEPGHAGKLKGKLMFGASQLWGKVGRAFLRSISERQYARFPSNDVFTLDRPLEESLRQWLKLVSRGPPRTIELCSFKKADLVIFTDGFSPDPREDDHRPDRIGGVIFDRRMTSPVQFTSRVPKDLRDRWLVRKTQIIPVEMLAPIVALETFSDRLFRADIFVFIDSEVVEASLVKGYSSREDLCLLVSVFWDLVLNLQARIFIDRVATDANPADPPSRDNLDVGARAGWQTVPAQWPVALSLD